MNNKKIQTLLSIRTIRKISTIWTILTKRLNNMKLLYLSFLLFLIFPAIFSQETSLTNSSIKEDLKNEEVRMREILSKGYNGNKLIKEKTIEFSIDTFLIEKELELKLNIVSNLFDKELALNDAVYAYNRLVGKYLDLLNEYLDEADQNAIKQSQMSWLEYKRHEFGLLENIARKPYPGGKEIDDLYITHRVKELNKSRVRELCRYYLYMQLKKDK